MDLQLTGKVALVTAASKGLGKATARQLAHEGAQVAICSRSVTIDESAAEIGRETGAEVLALRADLTRPEEISGLVQSSLDHFGQIDILVINAGGPPPGNFLDLTPDHWSNDHITDNTESLGELRIAHDRVLGYVLFMQSLDQADDMLSSAVE